MSDSPRISHVASRPTPGDGASIVRRRWETELPREEIASLLAEKRLLDLLTRLGAARARFPKDLELIRSIRVLELHLGVRVDRTG